MTFIHQIVTALLADGWDKLKNYTLIFPMQRAEVYFKQEFRQLMQQSGRTQPVVLPRMLTIDALVDELSDLRLCDEIHAVCSLYDIYRHTMHTEDTLSLDAFYGWGRQLIQDFSDIDMALCKTKVLISNLSDAHTLDEMDIDEQIKKDLQQLIQFNYADERINAFFHTLWQNLPEIYERFTRQQAEQQLGTKGACYRYVTEHFPTVLPRTEGHTMVFVGFNYLLPAEREIMDLFKQQGKALFFWDDDPAFTLDDTVYQFIRAHQDDFPNAFSPSRLLVSSPEITAISTMSINGQVQYVSEWLNEHVDDEHPSRTAIVITDESVLESVLYALPDSLSDRVNITKGFPLKSTTIYAQVVTYLSNPKNDRNHDRPTYVDVLKDLIQHLDEPPRIDPTESATWQQLLQQEAYCQTLLVINRFMALFEQGVLQAVTELRTLRNLLRRALETVTLPFHGDMEAPIQVIGVLETRLLDFDQILVLNVEEGVVPAKASEHSFIPFDLRKAYQMPTHDEEAKIYAYNFFRLIRRSGDVTLMYSEAAGELSKKSMSRFLMQMLLSPSFDIHKRCLNESTETTDSASFPLDKKWGDKDVLSLSPSALATYIECPRQFYLSYVMGVKDVEGTTKILSPSELGTLFHGAIQHAYLSICGGAIHPYQSISSQQILDYLGAEDQWTLNSLPAIDAGFQKLKLSVAHEHKAETEVVRTMLRKVLEYDATCCEGLQLVSLEGDYRRTIRVDGHSIQLGGIIDRLDSVVENGQRYLRILDYKTGSHQLSKTMVSNMETLFSKYEAHYVLQTLLYSSVCLDKAKQINPQGYAIMPQLLFTQKLSADKHLLLDGQPIMDFSSMSKDFDAGLIHIIHTILSEPLEHNPWHQTDENTCEKSYCPFHLLCGR